MFLFVLIPILLGLPVCSLSVSTLGARLAGVFTGEFEELFPDLPDSDRPAITLAMHQSPDGSAYWISGQGGIIVGVGTLSFSLHASPYEARLDHS